MQKMKLKIRTLFALIALMTVATSCAPKTEAKPAVYDPKLLQEKNSTDTYAIPLDESDVEDQEEIDTLQSIGEKNAEKKAVKAKAAQAAQPVKK